MPTVFPFKATWRPEVSFTASIQCSIAESRLQKEQRSTPFGEDEVHREYTLTYPTTDFNAARRLRNTLAQGQSDDSLFWVPFALEPVDVELDWSSPGYDGYWSGASAPLIGGPDWWTSHRILRPREEFVEGAPVSSGTFEDVEKVIRINRMDPEDYEAKTLLTWNYNLGGLGFLGYTIDSVWTGTSPSGDLKPAHIHQYFHMDLVMLVSLQERPLTDTHIMNDITWRGVR